MSVSPKFAEYDGDLQLQDVSKRNWKTAESRDKFDSALEACRREFSLVEILSVADPESERRAAVFNDGEVSTDTLFELVAEHGLGVAFGVRGRVAVGGKKSVAEAVLTAEEEGDHEELGRLLGYPECCVDAFSPGPTPVYEIACRTDSCEAREDRESVVVKEPDALTNIMWAHRGWKFISHVPCSFECEHSAEIGRANGAHFRALGLGEEAELLWEFLSEPLTWDGYHGLSNVRNGYAIGSTNTPPYWSKKEVVWVRDHVARKL